MDNKINAKYFHKSEDTNAGGIGDAYKTLLAAAALLQLRQQTRRHDRIENKDNNHLPSTMKESIFPQLHYLAGESHHQYNYCRRKTRNDCWLGTEGHFTYYKNNMGPVSSFFYDTFVSASKRIQRCPWCVDDKCALGWVMATPQAERFADSPLHKKNSIYTMVGKALTARPPDGF